MIIHDVVYIVCSFLSNIAYVYDCGIVVKLNWQMSKLTYCFLFCFMLHMNTAPTALNADLLTTDLQYHESKLEVHLQFEVYIHVIKHYT